LPEAADFTSPNIFSSTRAGIGVALLLQACIMDLDRCHAPQARATLLLPHLWAARICPPGGSAADADREITDCPLITQARGFQPNAHAWPVSLLRTLRHLSRSYGDTWLTHVYFPSHHDKRDHLLVRAGANQARINASA